MAEQTASSDLNDVQIGGAFMESLKRSNKQIRDDRAAAIGENAEITYRREIEDMRMDIKRLKRKRENKLDMSPTNADSLILGEDFDAPRFVKEDVVIGVELRNLEIKLGIAEERYQYLFGGEV